MDEEPTTYSDVGDEDDDAIHWTATGRSSASGGMPEIPKM